MTRVASFSQSQSLLQGILRNQSNLFEAQKQVNTGKKSDDFAGIANQVSTLVGAKALKARTESYISTGETITRALQVYDVQLGAITDTAREARQTMIEALAQDEAVGFTTIMGEAYNRIASALNTKIGGNYIFAGSKSDTPPLATTSFSDLTLLATASDAFQNDGIKARARVADNVETEYGVLASDVADLLLASFKRIADFDAGPDGPIDGKLTANQRAFLESELLALDGAIADTQNALVTNGLKAKKLDEIKDQHVDQRVFLETFVSDIEDVNIAEAITRLNNDQAALAVSFRVVGQISRLSLADFI
ncbi:MAG: hypothetical protein D6782_06275 [Alphaproteobacteria bacterium]|nr:MAG: hypothetical protein D6782_06275 [Alphaproteobacteria bacterium]